MAPRISIVKRSSCSRGVTLVEMLVVIAIVAILAAIAAPSFRQMTVDTRMSTQANDFLTMINYTRSEAVKRNVRVTMCKSSSGTGCSTAGNWEQGWIVFVDSGANAGIVDSGETILKVHGALSNGSTLTGAGTTVSDFITYMPNGQARTAAGVQQGGAIKLCSNESAYKGRNIIITSGTTAPTGNGRAMVDSAQPSCP